MKDDDLLHLLQNDGDDDLDLDDGMLNEMGSLKEQIFGLLKNYETNIK